MEQELRLPYDRKLSEAVWRRVLPELSPGRDRLLHGCPHGGQSCPAAALYR